MLKGETIRTAIAAFGLVFTVGSAGLGTVWAIKNDISELKFTVASLSQSVSEIKCDLHPSISNCHSFNDNAVAQVHP